MYPPKNIMSNEFYGLKESLYEPDNKRNIAHFVRYSYCFFVYVVLLGKGCAEGGNKDGFRYKLKLSTGCYLLQITMTT